MMEKLKDYLNRYFEHAFVLLILLATSALNYFVPHKIAFLNFYFLPIILGAYYLGQKRAMLGAVFCFLMVLGYLLLDPEAFLSENWAQEVQLHLFIWGGFLILAGAVVGRLHDKLKVEVTSTHQLNLQLERSNEQLRESNQNLEGRVQERTLELQQSKTAVENLKTKVESALYSTMDSAVVNLMIEGRLRNENRQMSVMFVDLVGF